MGHTYIGWPGAGPCVLTNERHVEHALVFLVEALEQPLEPRIPDRQEHLLARARHELWAGASVGLSSIDLNDWLEQPSDRIVMVAALRAALRSSREVGEPAPKEVMLAKLERQGYSSGWVTYTRDPPLDKARGVLRLLIHMLDRPDKIPGLLSGRLGRFTPPPRTGLMERLRGWLRRRR